MNTARVLSDEDFAHQRREWFVLGCVVGTFVTMGIVVGYFYFREPRVFTGPPEIVSQTRTETTWRIPMRQGGREVDCTITVADRRTWSVSC